MSNPAFDGFPSVTVHFRSRISAAIDRYSLQSGLSHFKRSPFMRIWTLWVNVRGEWRLLDQHKNTNILGDCCCHAFVICSSKRLLVDGVRLCQDGRNGVESKQMHLAVFMLSGDVVSPLEVVGPHLRTVVALDRERSEPIASQARRETERPSPHQGVSASESSAQTRPPEQHAIETAVGIVRNSELSNVVDRSFPGRFDIAHPVISHGRKASSEHRPPVPIVHNCVVVNESLLFPEMTTSVTPPATFPQITEMTSFEEVRGPSSSRFGTVRLVRRATGSGFEYFAAKYYNPGSSHESGHAFTDRMLGCLGLSHPHVMRIVGLIAPVKERGPIVLMPYSELGSLEDVLNRVRLHDPPAVWNNATKLRMIVSLVSGLNHLHSKGIVHHELKPTNLIVQPDGSIRFCGYLTSAIAKNQFTRASQIGSASYIAPEQFKEREDEEKVWDLKIDVFHLV
jgi:hypothetical protein